MTLEQLKAAAYDCMKGIKRLQYEGDLIEKRIVALERSEKELGEDLAKGARHDSDKQNNSRR